MFESLSLLKHVSLGVMHRLVEQLSLAEVEYLNWVLVLVGAHQDFVGFVVERVSRNRRTLHDCARLVILLLDLSYPTEICSCPILLREEGSGRPPQT